MRDGFLMFCVMILSGSGVIVWHACSPKSFKRLSPYLIMAVALGQFALHFWLYRGKSPEPEDQVDHLIAGSFLGALFVCGLGMAVQQAKRDKDKPPDA